jgi:hypothetical protein
VPQVGHPLAGGGRQLAWLEDHAVAGGQGGDDVAVGQVHGEVERAQHRQHAAGLEAGLGPRPAVQRRHQAHALLQRHVHLGRQQCRLAARVPQRLAHLARDARRQVVRSASRQVPEALQHRGARLVSRVAPGRERGAGAADGLFHRGGVGDGETAQLVVRVRR